MLEAISRKNSVDPKWAAEAGLPFRVGSSSGEEARLHNHLSLDVDLLGRECELGQGSPSQLRQFPKLPKGVPSSSGVEGWGRVGG